MTAFILLFCTLLLACGGLRGESTAVRFNFDRHLHSWYSIPSWKGKISPSADAFQGKGAICLTSEASADGFRGKMVSQDQKAFDFAGKRFRLSYYAKGKGELRAGLMTSRINSAGGYTYGTDFQPEPLKLGPSYQKYEAVFDLQDRAPMTLSIVVTLTGEGHALLDEVVLTDLCSVQAPVPVTGHLILPAGAPCPGLEFRSVLKKAPARLFITSPSRPLKTAELTSDEEGRIFWKGEVSGPGLNTVTVSQQGSTGKLFLSVIPQETFRQFEDLSRQLPEGKGLRILWLGDSICDFQRGRNAVDKLGFWLNRRAPGRFQIENRAVRGDFILRTEQRLSGQKCYQADAYRGMWEKTYDLIILQLGNNDTMATTNDKFASPQVPTARLYPAYQRVLKLIRQHSQAPVMLTSANYADVPRNERNAKKALGRWFFPRFGMDEYVLPFNETVRKFAADNGCIYLDLHTPMKQQYRSGNYRDGIHLSEDGHTMLAGILLKEIDNHLRRTQK